MSVEEKLGNFFKAEIKASGRKLLAEEKISITGGSDTTIQVYVRASPPLKVLLVSSGVGSISFTADCSCPAGKKKQFCKHVWGALLGVEQRFPDFLSAKTAIEKPESSNLDSATESPDDSYSTTARIRNSEYRKEQYQKQKAHAKDLKRTRQALESAPDPSSFPPEIATALRYFSKNGFPMSMGPSEEIISDAKRTLSRVFHPDRGGSHEEIVELNENCEVLLRFLRG